MVDKALISELTWRSLEMQKSAFADMPHFVAPDELAMMLRPTNRPGQINIHVISFGVIADSEKDFGTFMFQLPKNASVISREEDITISKKTPIRIAIALWREARTKGAAKIGARISADNKKAITKAACEKIKDMWPLPSKTYSIADLEKISGISRNSIVSVLGPRTTAQHNYRAKLKRKANAKTSK